MYVLIKRENKVTKQEIKSVYTITSVARCVFTDGFFNSMTFGITATIVQLFLASRKIFQFFLRPQ